MLTSLRGAPELLERWPRSQVLLIATDGHQATLYELQPRRTLLGAKQEAWLFDSLRASKSRGARWRVVGQQILFSPVTASAISARRRTGAGRFRAPASQPARVAAPSVADCHRPPIDAGNDVSRLQAGARPREAAALLSGVANVSDEERREGRLLV